MCGGGGGRQCFFFKETGCGALMGFVFERWIGFQPPDTVCESLFVTLLNEVDFQGGISDN